MTNVIPIDEFARTASREQARVVRVLRDLADQLEELPLSKCREVLPVAAWGVDEIATRLQPWVRPSQA